MCADVCWCVCVCSLSHLIYSHTIPANAINMNILFAAFWANATHKVKYINNEFSTHGLFIHRREIKTPVTHVYSSDKKTLGYPKDL